MRADLHIHSCLSPCADLEMSPRAIARAARRAGLELIALTDHNTARNVPAFAEACREEHLFALYGCEVTTVEEAHVLCLFEDGDVASDFGEWIYRRLAQIPLRAEKMGDQPVVDEGENVLELLEFYLGAATDLPLADLVLSARERGGLVIPSHIDRPAMSLLSQLGRIPDLPYDAVEISRHYNWATDSAGVRGRYAMIRSSDAHTLGDLGRGWTDLRTHGASVRDIREALQLLRMQQG